MGHYEKVVAATVCIAAWASYLVLIWFLLFGVLPFGWSSGLALVVFFVLGVISSAWVGAK